jgi:hypothetical protein
VLAVATEWRWTISCCTSAGSVVKLALVCWIATGLFDAQITRSLLPVVDAASQRASGLTLDQRFQLFDLPAQLLKPARLFVGLWCRLPARSDSIAARPILAIEPR